jgi:tripartite-type tricarboxylate transporter receptor subunit TctC
MTDRIIEKCRPGGEKTQMRRVLSILAVLVACGVPVPALGQVSFEGKTIRLSVNFAAGGPADLLARQIAPFIARHIPGKPTIVVENRTGAAGMIGANHLFNSAKPDGLTIGYLVGITTQGLIGGDNIRFDPAKFRWLGALSQTQVLLARKDLKLATPRDLLMPATPLVYASSGATSTTTLSTRLFFDMIGVKAKFITGFRGQADSILALARGEVNLDNGGLVAYLARRDAIRQEGIFDAIVQRGELNPDGSFRRNRLIPEIPTMIETIAEINPAVLKSVEFAANRSIVGSFAVHFGLMLPPATDEPIVRTLRKAVADALNDPEARAMVETKLKSPYDFVDGEACERIVAQLRHEFYADPRIAQTLNRLMSEK